MPCLCLTRPVIHIEKRKSGVKLALFEISSIDWFTQPSLLSLLVILFFFSFFFLTFLSFFKQLGSKKKYILNLFDKTFGIGVMIQYH